MKSMMPRGITGLEMVKRLLTFSFSESKSEPCQQILKQQDMEPRVTFVTEFVRATSKLFVVNSHIFSFSRHIQSKNRPLKLKDSCLMTTTDK
jgi:hypothetical protein